MKKRNLKSLSLNKKSISNLSTQFTVIGGADDSGLRVTCAICVVSKKPEFCIGGGTVADPGGPGPGSDHFSCPGNPIPSCHFTDCQ